MRKYALTIVAALLCVGASAQYKIGGKCGEDVKWEFDGYTLTLSNVDKKEAAASMDNYNLNNNAAPWIKKQLAIKKVVVGVNVERIGSCAFANCTGLREVVFDGTSMAEIGWGAFMNCTSLKTISLPAELGIIGNLAFANCSQLPSIIVPEKCRVGDMAFASCTNVRSLSVAPTAQLGDKVFVTEVKTGGSTTFKLYDKEVRRMPAYVNADNCGEYGIASNAMEVYLKGKNGKEGKVVDYDEETSDVDKEIPLVEKNRHDLYALIIGNENYRFVSAVPYARHDARVFAQYCEKTLGIPAANIRLEEDATKAMIMEEAIGEWLASINQREDKHLIVYYAGHGVPDTKDNNRSYLLPTDIRGTNPKIGIDLEKFYSSLGKLNFRQTTVFLDACFSGVNRTGQGVMEGTRGVAIKPREAAIDNGNIVVFAAAQANEMAQSYTEEGHGVFTYSLLKALQDTWGNVPYRQLSQEIRKQMNEALGAMGKRNSQKHTVNASGDLQDWGGLGF